MNNNEAMDRQHFKIACYVSNRGFNYYCQESLLVNEIFSISHFKVDIFLNFMQNNRVKRDIATC